MIIQNVLGLILLAALLGFVAGILVTLVAAVDAKHSTNEEDIERSLTEFRRSKGI